MPELTNGQLLTVISALVDALDQARAELADAHECIAEQERRISGYEVQEHNMAGMAAAAFPELKDEPRPFERVRLAFVGIAREREAAAVRS